jgi:hypothetical protein
MKSQECLWWRLPIIAGCPTVNEELRMVVCCWSSEISGNVLWWCWDCRVYCHHDRVMPLYLFQVISLCILLQPSFYLLQTTVVTLIRFCPSQSHAEKVLGAPYAKIERELYWSSMLIASFTIFVDCLVCHPHSEPVYMTTSRQSGIYMTTSTQSGIGIFKS